MKSFIYLAIVILINVAGQSSIKYGTRLTGKLNMDFGAIGQFFLTVLKQPFIVLGFVLYGIGSFIYIAVLSRTDLSLAYPILSISYVFILLISWSFFGETMNIYRILGMVLIATGVIFLAKSV